eukprot:CCRYP_005730-RA/>CCRYP_005730-RA protein AED:0.43 eAED:0.42 QI:0/0/0/1/0/0/2/0/262
MGTLVEQFLLTIAAASFLHITSSQPRPATLFVANYSLSEAADVGVSMKRYHSDNGVFGSAEFRSHCQNLGQGIRFSGVGAHHQNGVAERAIRTVTSMARANMLHATLHWPERSFIDLWPLAMDYAVWVYNRLPQHGAGLDGKKIPKWDSRARQGIFVGFSTRHSSLVPLILNPRTQHISPQYHVIFDDAFTTVPSLTSADERDLRFEKLFQTARECYIDSSDISPSTDLLDDHWLSPSDLAHRQSIRQQDLLPNSLHPFILY